MVLPVPGGPTRRMPLGILAPSLPKCFGFLNFMLQGRSRTFGHICFSAHKRELENRPLPPYVANEFEAYLKCGILAHGFLRLKCCSCSQEKVVAYPNGVTHLLFTLSEFLEKITALIPPPRQHQIRWSGCFATKSPYLTKIRLKPEAKKGFDFADQDGDPDRPKNSRWACNLAKAFKLDVVAFQSQ